MAHDDGGINTPLARLRDQGNEGLLRALLEKAMRAQKSDPKITAHELVLELDLRILSHSALGEFDSSNGVRQAIVQSGAFTKPGKEPGTREPITQYDVAVQVSTAPREGVEKPHVAAFMLREGAQFDGAKAEQYLSAQDVKVTEIAGTVGPDSSRKAG